MKQFILITLLSSVLCCYLSTAQPLAAIDTLNNYIIDKKPVENFDGTQLEGKSIVSYQIATINSSPDVILVHYIRTKDNSSQAEPIYVIDGKKVSKRRFENLNPSGIRSIIVVKNGSLETVKQYPGWENGVILVETQPVSSKDSKVNIGYGVADSHDVSYSVSSSKPEENEFYTNMFDYLRGKVAGVQVGPDDSIFIRGINSMNASKAPLILVDGMEITDMSNLKLINPRDVYSVDVLKDASASIYGIKGANGVILITTKNGRVANKQ